MRHGGVLAVTQRASVNHLHVLSCHTYQDPINSEALKGCCGACQSDLMPNGRAPCKQPLLAHVRVTAGLVTAGLCAE